MQLLSVTIDTFWRIAQRHHRSGHPAGANDNAALAAAGLVDTPLFDGAWSDALFADAEA